MPNTNEVSKGKKIKPLSELKISPAPWECVKAIKAECGRSLIVRSCRGGECRSRARRVATGFKRSHNISHEINTYAVGKYSRCGFRWNAHGGHGNARIDDRRREVYARMAKIENGWRTK